MDIYASKEEFEKLEYKRPDGDFNGCVIIPTGEMHDSGFGCMRFALTMDNEIVGCVGGGSDIIHLNGIGGYGQYGEKYMERVTSQMVPVIGWSIDCLPSGFLRIFSHKNLSIEDIICSDFILYAKEGKNEKS